MTHREIAKFSREGRRGATRSTRPCSTRVADFLEPMLTQTPPDPWSLRPRRPVEARQARAGLPQAGPRRRTEAVEILTGAARPILDRWFESEQLKATLATDAVIGAFAAPSQPGTAYVLFHHVMGECDGVRGVWGYVRGGMGSDLATASRPRPEEHGRRDPHQRRRRRSILVKDGRAVGVALEDGTEFTRKPGGLGRRRERHVPQADGREGPAAPTSSARCSNIDYSQRDGEDQRRPRPSRRSSRRCRGTASARSTTARCTSARPWTTSSGPTTTPSTAGRPQRPDARMHDGDGPRRHARPAGQAHPAHVRAVRPVPRCKGTTGTRRRTSSPTAASTS